MFVEELEYEKKKKKDSIKKRIGDWSLKKKKKGRRKENRDLVEAK